MKDIYFKTVYFWLCKCWGRILSSISKVSVFSVFTEPRRSTVPRLLHHPVYKNDTLFNKPICNPESNWAGLDQIRNAFQTSKDFLQDLLRNNRLRMPMILANRCTCLELIQQLGNSMLDSHGPDISRSQLKLWSTRWLKSGIVSKIMPSIETHISWKHVSCRAQNWFWWNRRIPSQRDKGQKPWFLEPFTY